MDYSKKEKELFTKIGEFFLEKNSGDFGKARSNRTSRNYSNFVVVERDDNLLEKTGSSHREKRRAH